MSIKKFFDVTGIIALRKVELFNRIWKQIEVKLEDDSDKDKIKIIITNIISKLDNNMFIGKYEKITKKIDPNLNIDKLHLNEKRIIENIELELKRFY